MSNYAYVRISTEMQNLENQRHEILNWSIQRSISVNNWVTEAVSGTVDWEKRRLGRLLKRMKKGDLLICTELSRLGRNLFMVMSILNYCSAKGISVHTIKDGFDLSNNLNSKIIAFAFALAAEIERSLISQRTKEALAAKRSSGVRLGRPKGPSQKTLRVCADAEQIERLLANGVSRSEVARKWQIHRSTLAKLIRCDFLRNL